VSAAEARRLACDARIIPAVLGGAGEILDLGRARRLFTGALRRALVLRDGGCAFPGCDRPYSWCEAHHIDGWAAGGDTALDNGVLLCGHHHRLVERGDWEVDLDPGGLPQFHPPLWVDPDRRPRHNTVHRTRAPVIGARAGPRSPAMECAATPSRRSAGAEARPTAGAAEAGDRRLTGRPGARGGCGAPTAAGSSHPEPERRRPATTPRAAGRAQEHPRRVKPRQIPAGHQQQS
jgi:hypothetical protein